MMLGWILDKFISIPTFSVYGKCYICKEPSASEFILKKHNNSVHSEVRKWSCPDCDSMLKWNCDLRIHMLKIQNLN